MPRTDQQLVTALESCQAAPNGFGPEHVSLCHEAARRLRSLFYSDKALNESGDVNRALLREVGTAHLVLKEIDRRIVDEALAKVLAADPERAKYAPKLDGRPGPEQ